VVGVKMKNLKKLLLCGLVVFTLTGCMAKQQETVKIDEDKNVSFKISISMDDEMLNNILKIVNANPETDISDESKWEYLTSVADRYENWNKEKIDKDGYKGYVLTYNTDTQKYESNEVLNPMVHEDSTDDMYELTID